MSLSTSSRRKRILLVGVNLTAGRTPRSAKQRTVNTDTDSSSATSRVVSSRFGTVALSRTRLESGGERRVSEAVIPTL